uniref:Pentacotripeptide-repeat region of PRORP domain-containing protein n=1 Tax=Craspedostauros australis TaxID=1486917 RepID=A0A7R9WT50_9STRA|eukprot:CAMPEP_0198121302 /NCGR_PEP_ID=MMETSP1442-20131203/31722_1 /TAXON_ID= /ORGANISM="Craspedostauros australis, Strain CCMP3328" /LENGTH=197 /DNA_ID=CAMNT_0043780085 /DNA_START=42 /DNA_END=635 /DNA_ORIENTATION=-
MPFKNLEEGGSAAKVETLFQIQEALYQQSGFNKDLKPNLRLFNSIMSVFARSNDIKKSKRAKRILDKMQAADDVEPDTITYYLVLKACANTRGDAEESLEAFQIALDTLNDFRARFGTDSRCFSMFLRACGNLMPPSRKRDAVIQSIFQKCCDDGLVSEFVLREFGRSSSEELQLQVLGGFLEDGVRLPKGWTRNVT